MTYTLRLLLIATLTTGFGCAGVQKTSPPQKQDDGMVEALGVAGITNGLVGKAKDDALADAKRNAVKKVLGEYISSSTKIQGGEFASSKITSKADGFIQRYKLLSAKRVSASEYQVRIKARVLRRKLQSAVSELLANVGKPRIMVLLQETITGQKSLGDQTVTGTELESILNKKGFPLVDPSMVKSLMRKQRTKIKKALAGNNTAAKELGVDAGAEIILVGNTSVQKGGNIAGSQLISMQATVRIRVVNVNNGRILAAEQGSGAYPHINPRTGAMKAIKRAVGPLSRTLMDTILAKWKPNQGQTINVVVTGLDYQGIMKLRSQLLNRVRGVKAVYRRGSAGKAAKMEVEFLGKSFDLADRLVSSNLDFRFKMDEVKANAIYMHASPK